jgi:acyl dehydratase
MAVDPGLAGRVVPPTAPYDVSRSAIAAFATAIGSDDPVHFDPEAARTAGHPDVLAPVTFPIVVAFAAMEALLADPSVGIELRDVVHADQGFEVVRPVRAGDVLTASLRVESLRSVAGTDLIATTCAVTTVTGEPVCTSRATLAHRSPGAAT